MKKLALKKIALALFVAVCGVNADDYEEYLEYKKWQEQKAKSQNKASTNSQDSKNSTNSQDSTQNIAGDSANDKKESLQNTKSGNNKNAGFIGLEFGFNLGSSAKFIASSGTTTFSGISKTGDNGVFNALNGSLIGGYQWYFSDMMGLGVRGLVGYNGGVAYSLVEAFTLTSIAWGLEAQYLLDFTQNVGMNIGAGFEASHLLYAGGSISSSVFVPAFSASLGLHFRTSNLAHNFGVTYRYRTYATKTIKTRNLTMEFSQGKAGLFVLSYYYRF